MKVVLAVLLWVATPAAAAVRSGPVLGAIPDDVGMLAAIDVAAARAAKSPTFAPLANEVVRRAPPLAEALASIPDPSLVVDTLVVGQVGTPANSSGGVFYLVRGRIPSDVLDKARFRGKREEWGTLVYSFPTVDAAWLGNTLAVAEPAVLARLAALVGGKAKNSAAKSKAAGALRRAVGAIDTKGHVWAVALAKGAVAGVMPGGVTARWIGFAARLGADLKLDARIGVASPAEAQSLVAQAEQALQPMRSAGAAAIGGLGMSWINSVAFRAAADVMHTTATIGAGDLPTILMILSSVLP